MIPLDKIEQVKKVADIVEVVSDFVKLKKRGNTYIGLSPFNNERTPSFTIAPSKAIYKDFSSGNGGDAIDFLMKFNNWSYIDAIKYLAKKYKIDIDIDNKDFIFNTPIKQQQPQKPIDFIHPKELLPTIENVKNNNLFKFIAKKFGEPLTEQVFKEYYIGTQHHNEFTKNWIIFWQVDKDWMVRSGKYIKYLENGHRDKCVNASWFHSRTKDYKPLYPNFNLVQCFFGEHLINEDLRKPIAIVESEKTAVIASLFMDKYIWLACGSKYGINDIKCQILKNRSVTLFPDLGAFNDWSILAKKYGFSINNSLEKIANDDDRKNGFDIADFLLR